MLGKKEDPKYTQGRIYSFLLYLGHNVKVGYLDASVAQNIIDNKDWEVVEHMIDFENEIKTNS